MYFIFVKHCWSANVTSTIEMNKLLLLIDSFVLDCDHQIDLTWNERHSTDANNDRHCTND